MSDLDDAIRLDSVLRFRKDSLQAPRPLHWRQLIALDNRFLGAIAAAERAGRRDIMTRLQTEFDRLRSAGMRPPHQQT